MNFQVYDSTRVSTLRGFATNNHIEVLVINIDSFAKDENIINKPNDKLNGQKPLAFIQAAKPIVIVDEPQNMETEKRIVAIQNLNSLCTLRYSATHRNVYNLTYSLNPVKAYDLGLVKQIEVDSIMHASSVPNLPWGKPSELSKIIVDEVIANRLTHCLANNIGTAEQIQLMKD